MAERCQSPKMAERELGQQRQTISECHAIRTNRNTSGIEGAIFCYHFIRNFMLRNFVLTLFHCTCVCAYNGTAYTRIQWDLSITDTLGTEKQFAIQRFPLFRGYFYTHNKLFGPAETVCYREVSTTRGVCCLHMHVCSFCVMTTTFGHWY